MKAKEKSCEKVRDNERRSLKNGRDEVTASSWQAIGVENEKVGEHLMLQLVSSFRSPDDMSRIGASQGFMHGMNPSDNIEAMLCSQMIGAHNLAMELIRRSFLEGQTAEGVDLNVNSATKLLRAFSAHFEALNRYRGKGQQKVTVEHVTVNNGGQAMIGILERPGGGIKNEKK